jgi:hypothetical protein
MPIDAGTDRARPAGRARARRRGVVAAALALGVASPAPAPAHEPGPALDAVAAVILNVARFTAWPAAAFDRREDALLICMHDDCPQREALAALDGLVVGGRTIAVATRAEPWTAPCHVAFVSESEMESASEAARAAAAAHPAVLLISDAPGFAAQGGAVGVTRTPDGVAFDVNVAAVERAGVHMSSKLLRLARTVEP